MVIFTFGWITHKHYLQKSSKYWELISTACIDAAGCWAFNVTDTTPPLALNIAASPPSLQMRIEAKKKHEIAAK